MPKPSQRLAPVINDIWFQCVPAVKGLMGPVTAPMMTTLQSSGSWKTRQSPRPKIWSRHGYNVLITRATAMGNTWLVCALAQQAARSGFMVLYVRAPRLLEELRVAHGDGSFARRLMHLAGIDLLAIDDFAIAPVSAAERNDLLALLDDRVGTRATLITSQLPVTAWHEWLNDPTLADAILDRIVHSARKIALMGESMRKRQVRPSVP